MTSSRKGGGNKLEKLLNKLIEKGWEPRGIDGQDINVCSYDKKRTISIGYMDWETPSKGKYEWEFKNLRELTSKESGLWQFVCENGMVKMKEGFYWQNIFPLDSKEYDYCDYQYWLIESALCNKDSLEKFLLDNINVKG